MVEAGQIYRHFKNKMYQVLCVAKHSETGELLVIYQKLYDDFAIHARPYDMFVSEVDHEKYPEVTQKMRFELVGKLGESFEHQVAEKINQDIKQDISLIDETVQQEKTIEAEEIDENETPNADLLAFLDADTYAEKHNLLIHMRPRMTDRLIDDIAAAMDLFVEAGDIDKRYKSLLTCVDTKAKFEVDR